MIKIRMKSIIFLDQEFRQRLPSWSMKDALLSAIASNQVVVISGETGCGKTTQVSRDVEQHCAPLDNMCPGCTVCVGRLYNEGVWL